MTTQNTKTQLTILVQPLKPALLQGFDQQLDVLVRIQAPDQPAEVAKPRLPHHLALVIDRSGSMSGEPLEEAKRCARHILDRMAPTDRAALVQFDNQVNVLVSNQPVGNGDLFRHALESIHEGGMTNLHGGWEAGAQALKPQAQEAGMARVILLSDGNANEGEIDPQRIADQCRDMAAAGVTTSTYGLGHSFNEDLMVAMAQAGQGNHYYAQTAKDLMDAFAEEFDLIRQLHARHLRLSIATVEGVSATLLNEYPTEDLRGFPVIRLPDLAWCSEAWALIRLKVPARLAGEAPNILLQVELTAVDLDGHPIAASDVQLKLPGLPPQSWEALLADELVERRRDELAAAALLTQARTAAQRGDWSEVKRLLNQAKATYGANPWLKDILAVMERLAAQEDQAMFNKEALYSSRRMSSRLASKEESMSVNDFEVPAFLRRKSAQGKGEPRSTPPVPGDDSQS